MSETTTAFETTAVSLRMGCSNFAPARPALHAKNCKLARDLPRPGPEPPDAAPKIADADEAAAETPATILRSKQGTHGMLDTHQKQSELLPETCTNGVTTSTSSS